VTWLKRIRGAVGMGLTWAVGWAVGGLLIGVASLLLPALPWDAFFEVFDAPLPALAVPGFFAGLLFSLVLGVAGRRRRLDDLSLSQVARWGAVGGVLLTALPFALVAVGLASREGSSIGTWRLLSVITGPFVAMSIVSATATLLLARAAARRELDQFGAGVTPGLLEEGQAGVHPGSREEPERQPVRQPERH
jgi:hypothetical protein